MCLVVGTNKIPCLFLCVFFFQVTMNLKLYFGVVLILASIYGTSFTFVVSCKCFSLGSYIFWLTIQNSVDSIHKISFEQTATKQPHNKFCMAKAPFRKIRELFFCNSKCQYVNKSAPVTCNFL